MDEERPLIEDSGKSLYTGRELWATAEESAATHAEDICMPHYQILRWTAYRGMLNGALDKSVIRLDQAILDVGVKSGREAAGED